MKKLALFAFVALLPLASFAFHGEVQVHQPLTLNATSGPNVIPAGVYEFKMSQKNKKLEFKINMEGKDSKFEIKSTQPFPNNGSFNIPAVHTGHPYNVQGWIQRSLQYSNVMWERVHCMRQIKRQVCHVLPNGMKQCHWEYHWVNGTQEQRYRIREEYNQAMVNMLPLQSSVIAATFNGDEIYQTKEIVYQGPCY